MLCSASRWNFGLSSPRWRGPDPWRMWVSPICPLPKLPSSEDLQAMAAFGGDLLWKPQNQIGQLQVDVWCLYCYVVKRTMYIYIYIYSEVMWSWCLCFWLEFLCALLTILNLCHNMPNCILLVYRWHLVGLGFIGEVAITCEVATSSYFINVAWLHGSRHRSDWWFWPDDSHPGPAEEIWGIATMIWGAEFHGLPLSICWPVEVFRETLVVPAMSCCPWKKAVGRTCSIC